MKVCFCHQKPERSFFVLNHKLPLCSRCSGMVLGSVFAFFFLLNKIFLPFFLALFLVFPLTFDGITQAMNLRESNNPLRFFTGIFFSIGFAQMVYTVTIFLINLL